MPNITFNWYRSAGDSNYISWGPITIGPNSGSGTWNLPSGTTYSVNAWGSGPGQCHLRVLSSQSLGLDDRQGAGADNDWNDMIINASSGFWQGNWPNIEFVTSAGVYGCTDSAASNYNPAATINQGCVYLPPTVSLSISKNSTIYPAGVTLSWSVSGNPQVNNVTITNIGGVQNSGSTIVYPSSTTTYVLNAYAPGNQVGQQSRTITVYTPPTVYLSVSPNPIVIGGSSTLSWYITGDGTSMTVGPPNESLPLGSSKSVSPTSTTTYTATCYLQTPDGDTAQDSKQVTLTVVALPSITISGDPEILYDASSCTVSVDASDCEEVSFLITSTLTDGTQTNQTVNNHQPTNGQYTFNVLPFIPWGDKGPVSVRVVATGTSMSGSLTDSSTHDFEVDIDTMPDLIQIPPSEDDPEEEVISPDTEVTSQSITINDIDIPVEVKASQPIKIDINDSNNWQEVREI